MISKQLSMKLPALTLALMLAGCGGGGSDGYYNNGNGSPSTGEGPTDGGTVTNPDAVPTNYHLLMSSDKPKLLVTGDTVVVTVKLVDVNGGGVSDQPVTLAIENTQSNGITIDGSSTVTTDSNGNAIFNLSLDPSNILNSRNLIANGVNLNATFKDGTGKITSQARKLEVIESIPTSEVAQYHLEVTSNKPTLVITGDNATITVKAIDGNGGGVANQNVTLSVVDTKTNKVTITGSSVKQTDADGNAQFSITLPRTGSPLAETLVKSGIILNATITNANEKLSEQTLKLNVSKGQIEQPIGNITFGKSGELQKTADALYYREALSAHVVDIYGVPLPNYRVTMNIDLLRAGQGFFMTKAQLENIKVERLAPVKQTLVNQNNQVRQAEATLASLQSAPVQSSEITSLRSQISAKQSEIRTQNSRLATAQTNLQLAQADEDEASAKQYQKQIIMINGTINQLNLDIASLNADLTAAMEVATAQKQQQINQQSSVVAQLKNTAQETTDKINAVESLKLPARFQSYCEITNKSNIQLATGFVDPNGNISSTFTYTTDATGKFNFSVQYLRQYAGWQTVEFKAKTNVSTKDLNSSLVYTLGLLKADFESEASQPFDDSPYGPPICNSTDPFTGLL
ncbi:MULTISPECIES: Ig-like domain-containing protein [unclassified Acinetobacter]|uniref:Ig-like domain-containing protein n=1 Tax=unclassified Acinetobacter TaxID=196816 RepID=UPI0015D1F049|nr:MULTISPECIES: Ig-like domain-containing protein [unclassified Acinetobacter]